MKLRRPLNKILSTKIKLYPLAVKWAELVYAKHPITNKFAQFDCVIIDDVKTGDSILCAKITPLY